MIEVQQLLKLINYEDVEGAQDRRITSVTPLDSHYYAEHSLTWVSDKNLEKLRDVDQGAVVCPSGSPAIFPQVTYIRAKNPRLVFSKIQRLLFPTEQRHMIASTACIMQHVRIAEHVCIEHHVVIEEGCDIGPGTVIGAGTVIRQGTRIGRNVTIGSNCSIGGPGFGYEKNEHGVFERINHSGHVVIGNYVEIGSNTCIDRAVIGATEIGDHCKIDNLVHIAHGVKIGRNSVIIANSMIAGSTTIGDEVWVAPSAAVLNKLTIADGAVLGMGSVIIRDVLEGEVVAGNPGKLLRNTSTG
ncbi:MAG: hypothetical protein RL160_1866, partial [Bacteroidota bacterium]|jgi:UDP-3-O-[3-hydroxymyristoyl] glucosamine N-acyltransferase